MLEETESLTVSLSLTGAPDGVQLSQQIATVVVTDEDGNEIDNHAICYMYVHSYTFPQSLLA